MNGRGLYKFSNGCIYEGSGVFRGSFVTVIKVILKMEIWREKESIPIIRGAIMKVFGLLGKNGEK
jgi:hypothetical protein